MWYFSSVLLCSNQIYRSKPLARCTCIEISSPMTGTSTPDGTWSILCKKLKVNITILAHTEHSRHAIQCIFHSCTLPCQECSIAVLPIASFPFPSAPTLHLPVTEWPPLSQISGKHAIQRLLCTLTPPTARMLAPTTPTVYLALHCSKQRK